MIAQRAGRFSPCSRKRLKHNRMRPHLMRMQKAAAVAAPLEGLSDTELVERIRSGDARAMEALMRRHNRLAYRTARAILRDDAEAEDAVQEAYIRAYRALESFRGESKLSTWLVRIVANEALMRRRRMSRSAVIVPMEAGMAENTHTEAAEEAGPEMETLRGQMRELLEAKIDQLPDGYRSVFVLRGVEELSVEKTAAALDIPEATVRTRYFRAKSLLRESLARDIDLTLQDAFSFAGERCDRIVSRVLGAIAT
jgi:RNA polymerase sigma-70 factor, ECF subfamily